MLPVRFGDHAENLGNAIDLEVATFLEADLLEDPTHRGVRQGGRALNALRASPEEPLHQKADGLGTEALPAVARIVDRHTEFVGRAGKRPVGRHIRLDLANQSPLRFDRQINPSGLERPGSPQPISELLAIRRPLRKRLSSKLCPAREYVVDLVMREAAN
jgi:hypothetical protein